MIANVVFFGGRTMVVKVVNDCKTLLMNYLEINQEFF